jgi:hypothetical protein
MRTRKQVKSLIFASIISFSVQAQNWQLGGNANGPGTNGLLSNSNFFGASGTADVRLGTGGNSRIFMSGTGATNPGFIGMGGNFLNPLSVLHVNSNAYNSGEVFRTNGPGTQTNAWRMFTGTGNGTEKFSLYVPASSDHVTLQTEANADMLINTGGNINRIVIKDGGVGSASGNIAIGNNLPANFNPNARLHLHHDDNSQVNLRFTHAGTGPTASDGSRLVLNPQADFFMINHEADRDLYFLTSGGGNPQTRLRILGNGLVEVGTPGSPSEIPSQMRFVNMSSNNTPNPNPGQGVLSVDDAGNVIYVQGGGGSSLGNLCTATQNSLSGNYQIPLNGNNFAFNGNGYKATC